MQQGSSADPWQLPDTCLFLGTCCSAGDSLIAHEIKSFAESVQHELSFLVSTYSFEETTISSNRVRYKSSAVTLEAVYSDRAEIDLLVDENPPTRRFQYALYLKLYHPEVVHRLGYGIATRDEDIRREVKVLAETLRLYGEPLLRHDNAVFERIKSYISNLRGEVESQGS